MKYDYARARATAIRLLDKFGGPGVLRVTTEPTGPGSGDPWDPADASVVQTHVDYPCTLVMTDYTQRDRAGTLIQTSDRHVYLSVAGLPSIAQGATQLVFAGVVYAVVDLKPLEPAGTPRLLYDVQVRT